MFNGMDGHVVNALVKVDLFHAVSVFFHQIEGSFDPGAERSKASSREGLTPINARIQFLIDGVVR